MKCMGQDWKEQKDRGQTGLKGKEQKRKKANNKVVKKARKEAEGKEKEKWTERKRNKMQ